MKKISTILLLISILSTLLIGCTNEQTNEITTPTPTTTTNIEKKYDFKDVNEIAASDLPIEEQYAAALELIDMETYLTQEYDNMIPITPMEAIEKMENGETFVIYHGRSECRYCKYVYPSVSEVAPPDLNVYYVNTDYFRFLYPEDTESELFLYVQNIHEDYKSRFDFTGVPNLKYIKNNKLELTISNPLSGAFFETDVTKEEREEYLQNMKLTLSYYLDYIYEDMTNTETNSNTQNVTISK